MFRFAPECRGLCVAFCTLWFIALPLFTPPPMRPVYALLCFIHAVNRCTKCHSSMKTRSLSPLIKYSRGDIKFWVDGQGRYWGANGHLKLKAQSPVTSGQQAPLHFHPHRNPRLRLSLRSVLILFPHAERLYQDGTTSVCTRNISGLYLDSKIVYRDWGCPWFSLVPPGKCWNVSWN